MKVDFISDLINEHEFKLFLIHDIAKSESDEVDEKSHVIDEYEDDTEMQRLAAADWTGFNLVVKNILVAGADGVVHSREQTLGRHYYNHVRLEETVRSIDYTRVVFETVLMRWTQLMDTHLYAKHMDQSHLEC